MKTPQEYANELRNSTCLHDEMPVTYKVACVQCCVSAFTSAMEDMREECARVAREYMEDAMAATILLGIRAKVPR